MSSYKPAGPVWPNGPKPGVYYITSASTGLKVSRPAAEDRSLLPKKVVLIPAGAEAAPWTISKNADGTYKLVNKGSPAIEISDKLFGELVAQDPPVDNRWKIQSVSHQGVNNFVIEAASTSDGWLVPNTANVPAYTQIGVEPLISAKSLPPQYPAFERFILTPA